MTAQFQRQQLDIDMLNVGNWIERRVERKVKRSWKEKTEKKEKRKKGE